ncbi:hypothetical protein AALO_G00110400 [Alosa alosa]|uniref:DUF4806 domain-containing protein n=1 Tax=Alosa alosa TaxID=278164 RepID=A0AAV6GPM5_9TELE|nr:hypothetical protein AALO_G00110400 [Alosa alosa]
MAKHRGHLHLQFITDQRVKNTFDPHSAKTAYLATLGGCNPGDVVRRMLRHIMDDEFAQQFNWLGRGGRKKAFSVFKITAVIRGDDTVSRDSSSSSSMDDDDF